MYIPTQWLHIDYIWVATLSFGFRISYKDSTKYESIKSKLNMISRYFNIVSLMTSDLKGF